MSVKTIAAFLIGGVILMVVLYSTALLYFTWPVNELSIDRSGLFGDSFGALTSLFSGLAFAGLIITILLQKEELGLQRQELKETRNEFKKSSKAQQVNARLNGLSTLLQEYKSQIAEIDKLIEDKNFSDSTFQRQDEIVSKRDRVLGELEAILEIK